MCEINQTIFTTCNGIREFALSLVEQVVKIEEISMNGAIRASQISDRAKIFGEIAASINKISTEMKSIVEDVQKNTQQITNWSLESFKIMELKQSMEKALELNCHQNEQSVRACCGRFDEENMKYIEQIISYCVRIRAGYEKLARICRKIWSVVLNLRIEARNVDEQEESFFSSVSDSLLLISEEISASLKNLKGHIKQLEGLSEGKHAA